MVVVSSILLFVILLKSGEAVGKPVSPTQDATDHKLTITLSERKPFVILNQNETPKGLDILIIENFARKLNLQIEYFVVNISLNNIFTDKNHFNAFPDQKSLRNSDILIGTLNENNLTNKHYIASIPYYKDALTWCVQKQKPVSRWMSSFYWCTDPKAWLLFLLTFMVATPIAYYLEQFEDVKRNSITIMFNILLSTMGFCIPVNPKTLPYRIYCITSIIGDILITTFFVAFLLKAIDNPKLENQVSSIEEIVNKKSQFELVGDRFALEHLIKQNETYPSELLEKLVICDDSNFDFYLNQLNENSRLAVAISREYARNIQRNMHYKLYCFEDFEIIGNYELKFFVRKEFPHLNELNAFIRSINAGGLIEKWRFLSRIKSNYKQEHEEKILDAWTLESYYGLLGLWWLLVVFSILLLPFEILVYKKRHTVNSFRVWMYVEMAIDPDRYFMLETIGFE